MPKLSKPVQGIVVVIVAVLVGLPIFALAGSDEEGFLGIVSYEVPAGSEGPISTAEPSEDAIDEGDIPEVTPPPIETPEVSVTEEPEPSATEEPVATEEPSDDDDDDDDDRDEDRDDDDDEDDDDVGAVIPLNPTETRLQVVSEPVKFPASRGADVNLLFQWFMFFSLLFGASFAVRKDFVSHRNIMTFNVLVNWFSITGRMFPKVGDWLSEANPENYAKLPIQLHAAGASIVMLFASYLIFRMWFEKQLPSWIKIEPIKVWMRLTLVCWLALIILGTYMYFDIHSN
jgi:hypothetical protein